MTEDAILTIVGPTAVGKTSLALTLARDLGGELVSVDSRQVYVGMDIGTGKEVDQGRWVEQGGEKVLMIGGVPVHGLDLVRPDEPFSVAQWVERINLIIKNIIGRGGRPILVGGTGFYLEALQGGIETISMSPNTELRRTLNTLPADELFDRLMEVDGERARRMNESDRQNPVRLIRAIEVSVGRAAHGVSSAEKSNSLSPIAYMLAMLGLTMERTLLYQRADDRVEKMFGQGLVEETKRLLEMYNPELPAMSGIGYREVACHVAGELTLEQAKQEMKYRTHRYIRRQLTWFKRQPIVWIRPDGRDWQDRAEIAARQLLGL